MKSQRPPTLPEAEGKRERAKAENRSAILAAALQVFTEIGYEAATVRDVIRRTPLAAGTFYNYFPDKQSLFVELLDKRLLALNARVREVRRAARTTDEFIGGAYRAMFNFVAGDPASFELVRRNAAAIRTLLGDSIFGASVLELQEDLARGIAEGLLPEVDIGYLASAMAGISFEVALRMAGRDPIDVEAAVRFASALVLGGIERLARDEATSASAR